MFHPTTVLTMDMRLSRFKVRNFIAQGDHIISYQYEFVLLEPLSFLFVANL